MQLNFSSEKPIFVQLGETIEDDILNDIYKEETQIPSTTEISVSLKINPATAGKGVNMLVDDGIVYKKRGVGMFVCPGAKKRIINKRKSAFYESYILSLLNEAGKLGITKDEIIRMIEGSDNI